MPNQPIICGFKGMAVIQIFKNRNINRCSSISKWIEIDQEIINSMMFTNKITKYIEIENDGNVIKLYNESHECVIKKYTFNSKHGIYINNELDSIVECFNLIECIDDSIEEPYADNIIDFTDFFNKISDKSDLKSLSRTSFTSISTNGIDEDSLDGIFIFGDCVH